MRSNLSERVNFEKSGGLVPAIVQNEISGEVLMLGYMNKEALEHTLEFGKITFFSRSKERLWMKGESSGNDLILKDVFLDCDSDALLLTCVPKGPTCHTGDRSCFGNGQRSVGQFLAELTRIIKERRERPDSDSYTSKLFEEGINRIAQKVGEEAVEVVIASKDSDRENFVGETADLIFHLMVLLEEKGTSLQEIEQKLLERHGS